MTYAAAGIDLVRYDGFIDTLGGMLKRTHGPRVISNPGGFAGLFRLDYNEKLFARNYRDPVLVSCADGVGTKIKIAQELGIVHTIGIDLVAMNVNDLIVEGAEPLFFLDCLSVHHVEQAVCAAIMHGVVEGCRIAGCALLGGETAEMGDLFRPGDFDLTGFAVGVVDLHKAMNRRHPEPGDVILGLASSGVHSNGFTLARKIVADAKLDLRKAYPELAEKGQTTPTLGQALLIPTRIYADPIVRLNAAYRVKKVVTGMAHITGGGLAGNLERSLSPTVDAVIQTKSWTPPAIFRFLQERGGVEEAEMRTVFNMGIGYCVVVRPTFAQAVRERLERMGETVFEIGKITKGKGRVIEK
ncbi:MAG: phosphoribosylformylglycinamidine cyclo-ligase [Phycisphaerales bacterium]|nr:phosphoribosylformylglycinamidine cyclo-ligase [Phycisphaerales bacterium]